MNTMDADVLRDIFVAGASKLEEKKEYVNELNVFPVPDGDTGTNMTMTIQSAVREVQQIEDVNMESVCRAISSGSLRGARGNSGVILSQLLRGFTRHIKEYETVDVDIIAAAFEKAVETAYKAVMKPKEGTILTVAKGGAKAACYLADKGLDVVSYFENIVRYMREVLAKTPDMLPVLKEAGVVDSGGEGLLIILEGALDKFKELVEGGGVVVDLSGISGAEIKAPDVSGKSKPAKESTAKNAPVKTLKKADTVRPVPKSKADISTSDIKFGYCTEFIIMLEYEFDDKAEAEFKVFLEAIGDSIVVVADDEIVKVHVHTNMPGIAIQKALTYGSLTRMKIDNMREEHNERLKLDEQKAKETASEENVTGEAAETAKESNETAGAPSSPAMAETETVEEVSAEGSEASMDETAEVKHEKEYGFIAVSAGAGLSEIFEGLGVDIVIEGGQTMNPSTEDILNAIDRISADNVFIFPNNSNIILASQQARSLVEDKNVVVIPSKTIPQGIMAMLNFMANKSPEDNEETMVREMANVKSGSVTYSIRDTVIQDIEIKQGDIMGIGDKGIMNTGSQVMATTVELVDKLIDEDSEIVTLYYGKDATEDEANLIADTIMKEHPEVEVEVHNGGQPVYYYLVSVE
ncbi:MAG: DAK2 domain-containing protein [Lachnospiraceae bacterium]|nr:DAK2 domain-containing protein [Lachnoclostridium sp.]MDY2599472.1 DAK2 domain-containing protein [Lachnospiraceae bacterium]